MNAVIIEDEVLIAKELQYKISEVAPDITVKQVLPSLKTARRWLMENAEPDLLFMDIQLSDGVSFELFETYQLKCPVIFTTAYDEYAIRAFKVNSVDYLLKPVDTDELKRAIEKSKVLMSANAAYPVSVDELMQSIKQPSKTTYKEKFIIQQRHHWIPVNTKEIACFFRENLNYIYTFDGDKYILDFTTLDEIEELLNPTIFYRVNRQFIIHIDNIQSVKPVENSKLIVTLKQPQRKEVDISRERAPAFKKWFDR